MIGTVLGLPYELEPLECHHLRHSRGPGSGSLNLLPSHWCGGVQPLATYHRYVAHLTPFVQREEVEGGADIPLSHSTRHSKAAVHLPQLKDRSRVILSGGVGLVPHIKGDVAYSQVPKNLEHPPVIPTTKEGKVRHRPVGNGVKEMIHPPDGCPYSSHTTAVDSVQALFDYRTP